MVEKVAAAIRIAEHVPGTRVNFTRRMSLLKLGVPPKKTFFQLVIALLKYRDYTMQCPEFPLFISLELTSSTFFALSLSLFSSSLLQRLLSSPSFLSLSFSRRKIHIFRQAMQRVSREADVRPTNCFFLPPRAVFLSKEI